MKNEYKAMVLSCIDPRFQPKIYNYLKKKNLIGKYSLFSIAGSAIGVTSSKFRKQHLTFWQNLETSIKLHKIRKLIVLNHEDCGAAKLIKRKKFLNFNIEKKVHEKSFKLIRQKLKKKFPKLKIETKLLLLK